MKLFRKTKLNSKGFSHLELLLVIVVVVVIAGVGFFVYKHGHKTNTAHAGGYTNLGTAFGVNTEVCHEYVAAYGGVNKVEFVFWKAASTANVPYAVYDDRNTNTTITTEKGSSYWDNVVASETVFQ